MAYPTRVSARLPAVDAYLANTEPFAQPILAHLREAIHRAVPDVEEAIKWSMPFFLYRGVILANMAGHKHHASFGLWGKQMVDKLSEDGVASGGNMGSFGRITSLADLPPTSELERYLHDAAALIGEGKRTRSIQRVAKPAQPEAEIPAALAQGLATNDLAAQRFAAFSPSCRREYAQWIAEAKRDETRAKRVAAALEWIADGKSRNWKYERPSA